MKNKLYLKNNFEKGKKNKKDLKKKIKNFNDIYQSLIKDFKNKKKSLNVIDDKYSFNFKINELKKFKKYKTIAIVGMGGSILGIESIYNFLEKNIKKKVYFFDDIDENKLLKFKKENNLFKVLFIIISKSGNTLETITNIFSLKILKKNLKNIILVSEKKNNLIFNLSKKLNLFFIEHNKFIGGRYSVLSETGILPAYLMGVNIKKLREKILDFLKKKRSFLQESSLFLSKNLKTKKINSLIFLNYAPELEKFLFWCQQLISESLGKKGFGFLPVISAAPKDHHSLLQLYLDGPKDKLFYIFSIEKKSKFKINLKNLSNEFKFLNKKLLSTVKLSQKNAVIESLKKNKIPFREIIIKKTSEDVLGKLFSFFILETIIVAKLSKINPYDQPAVEQVKVETKKLLN